METPMFFLPKGTPVFENMKTIHLNLPNFVEKLNSMDFTGYAGFTFPSAAAFLVFENGKLSIVVYEEDDGSRFSNLDALISLAHKLLTTDIGSVSAYKLSDNLSFYTSQLLRSKALFTDKEITSCNMEELLERIRNERFNGCLRSYTGDRSSLIFYQEGNPLGFFHDGSYEMETTVTTSQGVASIPNARIDLYASYEEKDIKGINLLEIINIRKVWSYAKTQRPN